LSCDGGDDDDFNGRRLDGVFACSAAGLFRVELDYFAVVGHEAVDFDLDVGGFGYRTAAGEALADERVEAADELGVGRR